MKFSARMLSHLAAAVVGIAIAASVATVSKSPAEASPSTGRAEKKESTSESAPRAGKKATRLAKETPDTKDFQQAWDGLVFRKLPRDERVPIQRKLLEAWAQVDLPGALDAAMNEAWDGGDDTVGTTPFAQVFTDRPLDAWALIQSGRYGVGAQLLRDRWVESVMKDNPLLVASMLSEFPGRMSNRIIPELVSGQPDEVRGAILAKITEQAGDSHDEWLKLAFKDLPADGNPEAPRER